MTGRDKNGLLLRSTSILTALFRGPEVPFRGVNHLTRSHVIVTSVIFTRNSIGNTTVSLILLSNTRNPQQTQEQVPKKSMDMNKSSTFSWDMDVRRARHLLAGESMSAKFVITNVSVVGNYYTYVSCDIYMCCECARIASQHSPSSCHALLQ